jgi:hypothetical protein
VPAPDVLDEDLRHPAVLGDDVDHERGVTN